MSIYNIVATNGIRALGTIYPTTSKEVMFDELWIAKKYSEALNSFPDKWKWYGEDIENEAITDIPGIAFSGIIFSEKAYKALYPIFKNDFEYEHKIEIDGLVYMWLSVPIISQDEVMHTKHSVYKVKPLYKTYVTESFVKLCRDNNLTGRDFVKVK